MTKDALTELLLLSHRHTAAVAELATRAGAVESRLHEVAAGQTLVQNEVQRQSQRIVSLEATCVQQRAHCTSLFNGHSRHIKKISDEVGIVKEDTGVIHMEQAKTGARWGLVLKLLAGLVAAAATAAAVVTIVQHWR